MAVFDNGSFSTQDKLEPKGSVAAVTSASRTYSYKPKGNEWKAGFAVGHSIGHAMAMKMPLTDSYL